MQRRALLFLVAAMSAVPALAADAVKREADRRPPSQLVSTPSQPAAAAGTAEVPAPARKPKRVRYTIPAPTRM